jgi:anti-sigma factor RsiW
MLLCMAVICFPISTLARSSGTLLAERRRRRIESTTAQTPEDVRVPIKVPGTKGHSTGSIQYNRRHDASSPAVIADDILLLPVPAPQVPVRAPGRDTLSTSRRRGQPSMTRVLFSAGTALTGFANSAGALRKPAIASQSAQHAYFSSSR